MNTKNIELRKTIENDTYMEYDLYANNELVGLFQTIEDNNCNYIFGRQIQVDLSYQGKGIATTVINDFIQNHSKPFRFCIATNSSKAINFWKHYIENTKFNKKNIRGEIWEIWK